MNPLDKLISHFEKFPGVGIRQAKRFAFHILTLPENEVKDLSSLINTLTASVVECSLCHRFFSDNNAMKLCKICRNEDRDVSKLLIVAHDGDIEAIERSQTYDGYYFVLGGTVPLLNGKTNTKIRSGALKRLIEQKNENGSLSEIIIGFAINPDGENTARFIESLIKETIASRLVKISYLGRGLSTGSELEYADSETIKNALTNRTNHS